jgi:carbamoyltransferase
MPELLEAYCEPDAEVIAAVSWSGASLRPLKLSVVKDMTPFASVADWLVAMDDRKSAHFLYMHPTWKGMRALMRATLFQAGLNLQTNPRIPNPVQIRRYDHHQTHAEYGCRSSPFEEAVCAVVDGYGEFGSTSFFAYKNGVVQRLHRARSMFNRERHSLGVFYGLVTGLCGFQPLKGEEWKIMGLAPYGRVDEELRGLFEQLIGVSGLRLAGKVSPKEEKRLVDELKKRRRRPGQPPIEVADIARTGQEVFVGRIKELLQNLATKGVSKNLVLCGGCALNSSWNGRILSETPFEQLHVPAAPGDDGNSVGAALIAYHEDHPEARAPRKLMSPYLGTGIDAEVRENLLRFNGPHRVRRVPGAVVQETAKLLAEGKIVGWMQGRAEFGPRALGHRSVLADPRSPDMKDRINGRVKFREEYRPFAPSILHEHGPEYFEDYQSSPYMERTLVFRREVRDKVPAVVHEDGTGRLQSVTRELSGRYYDLILAFYEITGVPIVLNTSFNIMGKPIIHSVEDAVGMFYTTGLDALVIDDIVIQKGAEAQRSLAVSSERVEAVASKDRAVAP